MQDLQKCVQGLTDDCTFKCLKKIKRGLEREMLRVDPQGFISQKDHPAALGSALTNDYITTDYSEALLEVVTPPFESPETLISFLTELHAFVAQNIGDELLWPSSMPCCFHSEDEIRIAEYGNSNVGQMKHIYRKGLDLRYGRRMQCISGIHYNFSLPDKFWSCYKKHLDYSGMLQDFVSHSYMGAVRNFERYAWLVLYLFGASPAVSKCFFKDKDSDLHELDAKTFYEPYATSFRMGDFGYKSSVQQELNVSYNSVDEYTRDLIKAIQTRHPEYEKRGVKVDGEYLQLSDSILQIENEYYGLIRPKRIAKRCERPTLALKRRGVEYVEVRCVDVNPFSPIGIDLDQVRFLDVVLLYCVLENSPFIDAIQMKKMRKNHKIVVAEGRKPGVDLFDGSRCIPLKEWAEDIFERLKMVAGLFDRLREDDLYTNAILKQKQCIEDPHLTLSGQLMEQLASSHKSFSTFSLDQAQEHTHLLRTKEISQERHQALKEESTHSLEKEKQSKAQDKLSLDEFIHQYFRGFG